MMVLLLLILKMTLSMFRRQTQLARRSCHLEALHIDVHLNQTQCVNVSMKHKKKEESNVFCCFRNVWRAI
jgi:hypothetical protein